MNKNKVLTLLAEYHNKWIASVDALINDENIQAEDIVQDMYLKIHSSKDEVINRMHIIQYIKGGGTISPHKDPIVYQKIQLGSVLNEFGKDFNSGGFSVFNKKKEKIFIEPKLKKGSLVCFMPSLYHTVDPVDPNTEVDLSKPDGRWYLSLTCVGSDHLIDRKKTTPINF